MLYLEGNIPGYFHTLKEYIVMGNQPFDQKDKQKQQQQQQQKQGQQGQRPFQQGGKTTGTTTGTDTTGGRGEKR
jgi:hypothetical protein